MARLPNQACTELDSVSGTGFQVVLVKLHKDVSLSSESNSAAGIIFHVAFGQNQFGAPYKAAVTPLNHVGEKVSEV